MDALRRTAAAALLALGMASAAQEPGGSARVGVTLTPADAQLVERLLGKIHETNLFEMEVGRLGAVRAVDPRVRRLGTRIARDHRLADMRADEVARARGVALESPEPSGRQRALLQGLERAPAGSFDQRFLQAMMDAHREAIHALEAARVELNDPLAFRLVDVLLPILGQHHVLAQRLRAVGS